VALDRSGGLAPSILPSVHFPPQIHIVRAPFSPLSTRRTDGSFFYSLIPRCVFSSNLPRRLRVSFAVFAAAPFLFSGLFLYSAQCLLLSTLSTRDRSAPSVPAFYSSRTPFPRRFALPRRFCTLFRARLLSGRGWSREGLSVRLLFCLRGAFSRCPAVPQDSLPFFLDPASFHDFTLLDVKACGQCAILSFSPVLSFYSGLALVLLFFLDVILLWVIFGMKDFLDRGSCHSRALFSFYMLHLLSPPPPLITHSPPAHQGFLFFKKLSLLIPPGQYACGSRSSRRRPFFF